MRRLPTEVLDHLESCHGVISKAQLFEAGVSARTVNSMIRDGLLVQVLQGAYRLRGQSLSERGRNIAVCVAHPTCVIAGPTAGRHWGLRRLPAEPRVIEDGELIAPVHVIAPPRSQPTVRRWVRPYRTEALSWDVDVVRQPEGLRITSPARTALDLARFVDDIDLLSIVEQVLRDTPTSLEDLRSVATPWQTPRRRWVRRFLAVLARVVAGGPADSHPEAVLGDALAAAGVGGLIRQWEIELPGYGSARFDLAVPALRWAIEVDVHPTHAETAGRRRDERRDRASHRLGWTITRVGAEAFGASLPATVERLVALHARLESSPPPSSLAVG